MNSKNLLIVGAGGHTRSLLNIIFEIEHNILGIIDESFDENKEENIGNLKIIGNCTLISNKINLILSIGDNTKRRDLYEKYENLVLPNNLIHKSAQIENYVKIGKANQIFGQVLINSFSQVGSNNIINTKALIEHESVIGNHNHISVGSIICGRVVIGDNCFLGAGSVVIDKVKICNDVIIGANSVVINNVETSGVYVGNPAKRIK